MAQRKRSQQKKHYENYLKGKSWKRKRRKIMQLSGRVCRVCRKRRATQVHHETYKRLYRERTTDLTAVCGTCHKKIHSR